MPSITYTFKYRKNSNLAFSAEEFESLYFFGIPIVDASGNPMSEDNIRYFIQVAQDYIEDVLGLKLFKEIIVEEKDFIYDDFRNWGFIRLTYMAMKAFKLRGNFGDQANGQPRTFIDYPQSWLSTRKTSDGLLYNKNLYLIPSTEAPIASSIYYLNRVPLQSMGSGQQVPNYNEVTYCTGFGFVPTDIADYIGKSAAVNIYHQLGDLILGAGIASQELSIDGLDQKIETTSSATNSGYGARILGYERNLKDDERKLISYYRGPVMTVC